MSIFSNKNETKKSGAESYFKNVNFYRVKLNGDRLHLMSDELINNTISGHLVMKMPNGVIMTGERSPVYYSGDSGFYKKKENQISLNSNVKIKTGQTDATSEHFNYFTDRETFYLSGDVKTKSLNDKSLYNVRIKSQNMKYNAKKEIINYYGSVSGMILRKRRFEQPVSFKSNNLELFEKDQKAVLTTNVELVKGEMVATSRSGEVFLENYNKRLKYFALFDDVIVKQKVKPEFGTPFVRQAFGEKLEGYTQEGIVVLMGYPKVYQKEDVIKGNIVILRDNNETIEVDNANSNFRLK